MSDYSITDHMASYDLYGTLNPISEKISENFSIPRVVTHLF